MTSTPSHPWASTTAPLPDNTPSPSPPPSPTLESLTTVVEDLRVRVKELERFCHMEKCEEHHAVASGVYIYCSNCGKQLNGKLGGAEQID